LRTTKTNMVAVDGIAEEIDCSDFSPAKDADAASLQDHGTSLWQLRQHAISLPWRLKGRGLLMVRSEAPATIFFCSARGSLWPKAAVIGIHPGRRLSGDKLPTRAEPRQRD
jgi:hypothetical protein